MCLFPCSTSSAGCLCTRVLTHSFFQPLNPPSLYSPTSCPVPDAWSHTPMSGVPYYMVLFLSLLTFTCHCLCTNFGPSSPSPLFRPANGSVLPRKAQDFLRSIFHPRGSEYLRGVRAHIFGIKVLENCVCDIFCSNIRFPLQYSHIIVVVDLTLTLQALERSEEP